MTSEDYLNWLSQMLFGAKTPQNAPGYGANDYTLGSHGAFNSTGMGRTETAPGSLGPMSAMAANRAGGGTPTAMTPAPLQNWSAAAPRVPEMLAQPDMRNQQINNSAQAMRYPPMQPPASPQGVPLPPPRPAYLNQQQAASMPEGQYQSNNRQVRDGKNINWGDSDNAADFFRADAAMRGLLG